MAAETLVPDSDIDNQYWYPTPCYAEIDEGFDSYNDADNVQDMYGTNTLEMTLSNPSVHTGDGDYIFKIRCRDKCSASMTLTYEVRKADHTLVFQFQTSPGTSYGSHQSSWSSPVTLTATELQNLELWIDGQSSRYPYVSVVDVQIDAGGWSHKLNGVESPSKVNGVSDFSKVIGVE
jgi:hypothetical protein